jgi:ABC-type Fe3+ transport system permease subunit
MGGLHKAASNSLLVGAFCLSLALWRWLSRRNATRIILTSDKRQPWSRADWIAGGILVVTVVSLAVIVYQTWGPKH